MREQSAVVFTSVITVSLLSAMRGVGAAQRLLDTGKFGSEPSFMGPGKARQPDRSKMVRNRALLDLLWSAIPLFFLLLSGADRARALDLLEDNATVSAVIVGAASYSTLSPSYWVVSDVKPDETIAVSRTGRSDGPGPTPYPDPARDHDWPGAGVIRTFSWMGDDRQRFWSERAQNHHAVVFIGDSLIAAWRTLKRDFSPIHVANLGISGDVSRGILFRLKEDVVELSPKAVVVLIGTNDLSAHEKVPDLISNLAGIIKVLRDGTSYPIVVCNLPSRDAREFPIVVDISEVNLQIAGLAGPDRNTFVLDLHRALALPDGSLDPANFENDRLHISNLGYRRFRDELMSIFEAAGIK